MYTYTYIYIHMYCFVVMATLVLQCLTPVAVIRPTSIYVCVVCHFVVMAACVLQFATAVTAMKRVPRVQNWCRSHAWGNMRSVRAHWAGLVFGGVTVTVSKCGGCAIVYYRVQTNMFDFTRYSSYL